ncbi:DUF3667 domain-containing protein [Aureitalea sp. L0-47]|uniref:DUF3667 domain-containing protein n=1 Tax=Aureitalea sp. L0-47 TaxID=2816962 RepID=UPI002238E5D2|nr:DUF3667 domain-containing protein [Aureitalea sp. L0-47]MCW5519291.1 DUF3667 domain-containing protein [Aureitalea sp. L0-47]
MNCKNCNHQLSETDNYCLDCGAKVIRNRLTMRSLIAHFSEQFLSYDNKFLTTFIAMFTKPQDVIGSYIGGTRKKYVNVISYFAIAVTISGAFFFFVFKFFPDAMDTSQTFAVVEQTPEAIEKAREMNRNIFEYQALIFFLSIPILAFMSRLVFLRNKKYNYVEHVVLNLYAYAHLSISVVILYMLTIWFQSVFQALLLIVIPLQIIYYAYVLKRLYSLSLVQIILKTLLFFAILIPMMIIVLVVLVAFLFAIGFYDDLIEAQKAQKAVSYIISSAMNWTS